MTNSLVAWLKIMRKVKSRKTKASGTFKIKGRKANNVDVDHTFLTQAQHKKSKAASTGTLRST
jgi:hypothetical protein